MDRRRAIPTGRLQRLQENRDRNLREQYDQYETLQSKPTHVAVPTGDRCNLQCIFCTDRRQPCSDRYTDLSYEQFLRFTEALENASLIQLYGWGEPFVNPDYEKIFDHVVENFAGARLHISTNGVLLTDRWIGKLLAYGKCLLNVSLNAVTPQTYMQVTGRDSFDRVVDNLKHLISAKQEHGVDDLVVSLSFVSIKPNIHELPRFIELSSELGINYVILQDLLILEKHHYPLSLGALEAETRRLFVRAAEIARERQIYLDSFTHYPVTYFMQDRSQYPEIDWPRDCLSVWEQQDEVLFYPQPGECYEPWQSFLISQNGAVTTCCRFREVMGNLQEQSFEEIWNGEKYRAYRRTINTFRPPEACTWCPVKTGCDIR